MVQVERDKRHGEHDGDEEKEQNVEFAVTRWQIILPEPQKVLERCHC